MSHVLRAGVRAAALTGLLATCGLALGNDQNAAGGFVPPETQALIDATPGLHADMLPGRVMGLWGTAMLTAKDPATAAQSWLAMHDRALGAGPLETALIREDEVNYGKFSVFVYEQQMDGVPVEFGRVRVIVLNTRDDSRVVGVSSRVAPRPFEGFRPDTHDGADAFNVVTSFEVFKRFENWSKPEMVIYFGEGDLPAPIEPVRAWKFTGELMNPDPEKYQKKTFFVDASNGRLLFIRNEVLHIDVTGQVLANATPWPLGNAAADHAGNPPILQTVPNIKVRIVGGGEAFTDANGNFTIAHAGTAPVTIEASVGDGRWARVADQGGTPLITASTTATPGIPATLTLNTTPGQLTNAQANAFIHQTLTHNHFKDRAPTFTALDTQLPANTAVSGSCNAFYNGTSTNYYNMSATCNNTAFSSVVAHEYGHHIVNRLGLAQGAFGEGFGDTMSMMIYDDPIVGRFFNIGGGAVRTPDTTNQQYPCSTTTVHTCGQILGNVMWELRKAFVNQHGLTNGRDMIRQQHIDWALITAGGVGNESANPGTLWEWLTIDDNDGNLNNGSPNYCLIVGAFAQSGIPEPQLTPSVAFAFPDGQPSNLVPGVATNFRVNVSAGSATPLPGTGSLYYRRVGASSFTIAPMTQGAANQYTATIPGQDCGAPIEYYVRVGINGGAAVSPYAFCAQPTRYATITSGQSVVATDDMEIDRGWTIGGNASAGVWERGDPIGTAAQPEDDTTPGGVNCWFTGQGTVGGAVGEADVDGGYTTLSSPTYNLNGFADAEIRYNRWYSNNAGGAPGADWFYTYVSTNGGSSWRLAQLVGPNGPETTGGWRASSFRLSDVRLTPTSSVRVRFRAEDIYSGSIVEAAIDDLEVIGITCDNAPPCPGDYNGSGGTPDDADVAAFFADWNAGDPRADINGSGGTPDDADVAEFFNFWNQGC
ncbi:MAG: M36 family metallopeptidase [Phycisphaerales bacterium]|nr:M36 family metallopeptidase [Phycisphaerales bacterium]